MTELNTDLVDRMVRAAGCPCALCREGEPWMERQDAPRPRENN